MGYLLTSGTCCQLLPTWGCNAQTPSLICIKSSLDVLPTELRNSPAISYNDTTLCWFASFPAKGASTTSTESILLCCVMFETTRHTLCKVRDGACSRNEMIGSKTSNANHRKACVLEFLKLHFLLLRRILWPELEVIDCRLESS